MARGRSHLDATRAGAEAVSVSAFSEAEKAKRRTNPEESE